jgi:TonB-linked SusC/RagA family outer membrane protein
MLKALCYGRKAEFISHAFTKGKGLQKLLRIMRWSGAASETKSHRSNREKIFLAMKLTMILLTAACMSAAAKGHTQGVNLNMKNAPLDKVFTAIEKQTGFYFTYTRELLQGSKNVDVAVTNASIKDVMDICVKNQPVTYEILDKAVVIRKRGAKLTEETIGQNTPSTNDYVPPIDVRGRVVDETGKPVVVTVTVKGTKKGTTTNDNGEFELKGVDGNAVLVISGVGIEPFEWSVNGISDLGTLNAKIKTVAEQEVQIQTGYQRINRERFVGSYSQLDSENFHRRAGMGIIERLDGTVPGVLFNKKGATELSPIIIRGMSTLGIQSTSTDPLIVIDNFPIYGQFNISNINPNDVESITVLKDAAAASIWGTRAGNGVIVITTKKGRYNQRFQLDFSSNLTIEEKPNLSYFKQISSSDYIAYEQYQFNKGAYDGPLSNTINWPSVTPVIEILNQKRAGLLTAAQAEAQIDVLRNYDLRDQLNRYVYREAVRQQHFLGFSGGTNLLAYQFSMGYNRSLDNVQGNKPNDQFTINTNTTFRPVRNLEIVTGIDFSLLKNKSTNLPALFRYPYERLADENGNPLVVASGIRSAYIDTVGGGNLLDWHYRPLDEIRLADQTSTGQFIRMNVGVGYQFTSWLKANVSYQYQTSAVHSRQYQSLQTYYTRDLINQFTNFGQPVSNTNLRYPVPLGGILDLGDNFAKDYNLRGSLNIARSFGSKHQLTALVGGEVFDSKGGYGSAQRIYGYDDVNGTSRGNMDYLTQYSRFYNLAGSPSLIPNPSGYIEGTINRFVSLFANAGYTYKNRYNLYASARRDGANVFGVETNNKWKPLWSAGASWDVSKEKFYTLSWLPYLKLRGSYGYTGNSNNNLSGIFVISSSRLFDPLNGYPTSFPGRAPNANLKWEEVRIVNLGIDFRLLNDRVNGSFEVYGKKSTDVISNAPKPPASGVTTFVENYGNLKTNGYDLTLNSRNIQGIIEWTTNYGWSHAKTVVTRLYSNFGYLASDFTSYGLNPIQGQIIYGLNSYKWGGLDPLTGDPLGYYEGQVSKIYNYIFNDSVKNQIFHGSALPLSSGFIRNNFTYRGVTLSFNITGRFQYFFREPAGLLSPITGSLSVDYYQRWQKPGDEAITHVPSNYYPIPYAVSQRDQFYRFAEIQVKKADNIRLQDVSVSYQWNNKGYRQIPFKGGRVFIYANNFNWIIWRSEKSDWDPDFAGGNGNGIAAPNSKTWTAGITLNF